MSMDLVKRGFWDIVTEMFSSFVLFSTLIILTFRFLVYSFTLTESSFWVLVVYEFVVSFVSDLD